MQKKNTEQPKGQLAEKGAAEKGAATAWCTLKKTNRKMTKCQKNAANKKGSKSMVHFDKNKAKDDKEFKVFIIHIT